MIRSLIKRGFSQTWQNKRMIWIFFLVNLTSGVLLVLPVRSILENFSGRSLMGDKLARGLDMDFVFEFFRYNENAFSVFQSLILIVPLIYWIGSLFLSGGALTIFLSGRLFQAKAFWGASAYFFARFLRLALLSVPVFALLFLLQSIVPLVQRILFGPDPYEYITYWASWIKFILRFVSIWLFLLIFDYARIYTVITDERVMRVSLLRSLQFVFRHFRLTFGLAFTLFLGGLVGLVLYRLLADILTAPGTLVVILLFLVQQIYVFFRMVVRLTLYAGESQLYQDLVFQPEVSPHPDANDAGIERAPA